MYPTSTFPPTTICSVFARFEGPDTDDTRLVLLKAVAEFAQPLTETFRAAHARVSKATESGEGKPSLTPPLGTLRACVRIYSLLTAIDLPEYFEDSIAEWMTFFHAYLT